MKTPQCQIRTSQNIIKEQNKIPYCSVMTDGWFQLANNPLPSSPGFGMSNFPGILAGLPLFIGDLTACKKAMKKFNFFDYWWSRLLLIQGNASQHHQCRIWQLFLFDLMTCLLETTTAADLLFLNFWWLEILDFEIEKEIPEIQSLIKKNISIHAGSAYVH